MSVPGLIQLPHHSGPPPSLDHTKAMQRQGRETLPHLNYPPTGTHPRHSDMRSSAPTDRRKVMSQRTLFDPANPHRPIVVNQREGDAHSHPQQASPGSGIVYPEMHPTLPVDNGTSTGKPSWYEPNSDSFRNNKCSPALLLDVVRCDVELSMLVNGEGIHDRFNRIRNSRKFLQDSLRNMLTTDLRFCQVENVEQHIWKISFHNLIEALRKVMVDNPEMKEHYKALLLSVIDEGTIYFESLLETLQTSYHFNLDDYLEAQPYPLSGLGFVGLAIVSCQKILIFLGDLARYREIASETSNYGKARSWYTKANLTNPKNGRPYNQLAILALYARRKLDAVYLYMRSLMASNPFHSAKESLVSLFDENRKKYELQDRKRREAKAAMGKETVLDPGHIDRQGVRREIWIHPHDGRKTRRTTSQSQETANQTNSDDEELGQLASIEINKRFVTSYLNVQGKLYTKIGMESFQECGVQMLREFRALLQHTPLPVNQTRLLQLLALNMFAVSNTQLIDSRMEGGYRSAWQECALIVSLEIFNILLERCNGLLKEQLDSKTNSLPSNRLLGEDLQIILPAIKVWCDWLICHSSVWNPPPTSHDYHVGPPGTPWVRLATLINLLSKLDTRQIELSTQPLEGYEAVRLPEDVTLCGFTPLMLNIQNPNYTPKTSDMDLAADCVRIDRMLYFGRDFLCGLDPPVLKLKFIAPSLSEYVSVVEQAAGTSARNIPNRDPSNRQSHSSDDCDWKQPREVEESFSEGEAEVADGNAGHGEMNQLRQRKEELTQKHFDQERRKQAILEERVQVELEVRPKFLVADTNCFIDHLATLTRLTSPIDKFYTLMVPLVVLNELDGLCRSRLSVEAKSALSFLREKNSQIRFVTSKGATLPTMAFTMEENDDQAMNNDDRILQCCLNLIRDKASEEEKQVDGIRYLRRDVVLLTDDRNLRVKCLSRDVPVRDLPAFLTWTSSAAR